jgi:hypothetical protein
MLSALVLLRACITPFAVDVSFERLVKAMALAEPAITLALEVMLPPFALIELFEVIPPAAETLKRLPVPPT